MLGATKNRRKHASTYARDGAGAAAAVSPALSPARAEEWPNRQIKVIVPYPPGGPTDISSRIVLEKVGRVLGQPVLFDNKGGASGMLGAEIAKTLPPDGYTFLATTVAMLAITRHLQPIPFDPDKDFLPVARMSTSWMALAVHPRCRPRRSRSSSPG